MSKQRSHKPTVPSTAVTKQPAAAPADRLPVADRSARIREAAFYIFLRRGAKHGQDVDDWLHAERVINAQMAARQGAG